MTSKFMLVISMTLTGEVKKKARVVTSSVLRKKTLRGSDYRIYAHSFVACFFIDNSVVEMTELLFGDPTKRTVLQLHNTAFVHAKLCSEHFSKPTSSRHIRSFSSRRCFCIRSCNNSNTNTASLDSKHG